MSRTSVHGCNTAQSGAIEGGIHGTGGAGGAGGVQAGSRADIWMCITCALMIRPDDKVRAV
jgi:hypothetical protein